MIYDTFQTVIHAGAVELAMYAGGALLAVLIVGALVSVVQAPGAYVAPRAAAIPLKVNALTRPSPSPSYGP